MPEWIDDKLPAMLNRKVWRSPDEGELSEAAVWQTPVSLLYEFFEVTKKTFPPTKAAPASSPACWSRNTPI